MVKVLQGLLGRAKSPIIINGQLFCLKHNPVLVSLSKYSLEFRTAREGTLLGSAEQIELMKTMLVNTESLILGKPVTWEEIKFEADVDTFSGAIVMRSESFAKLFKPENYELDIQHPQALRKVLTELMVNYISDYYTVFIRLLSRKITAQHMPVTIRSHFIAGLYQPLIVGTKLIPSPLEFEWNKWYLDVFSPDVEWMERVTDTTRKLNLNCVAMCDVAARFNTPVIFELDRKAFMLMSMLLILNQIDENSGSVLATQQQYMLRKLLYNPVEVARREGRPLTQAEEFEAVHYNSAQLFSSAIEYIRSMRTGLRKV